jgi:hypothetical protein
LVISAIRLGPAILSRGGEYSLAAASSSRIV